MPRRAEVLEAIRSGHTTAPAIARHLKAPLVDVTREVRRMQQLGRITDVGILENNTGRAGRPPIRYCVNEEWARKSREQSEETRRKIAASIRACWNDPGFRARQQVGFSELRVKKSIKVVDTVPKKYRSVFREIARVLGQEVAELFVAEALRITAAGADEQGVKSR